MAVSPVDVRIQGAPLVESIQSQAKATPVGGDGIFFIGRQRSIPRQATVKPAEMDRIQMTGLGAIFDARA